MVGSLATDVTVLTAVELTDLLARRRIGAVEAVTAYLDRIERVNPSLNAVIHLDAEAALRRAHRLDRARRSTGILHGLPMTLKDAHRVHGMPTIAGNPAASRAPAASDGVVAARLRSAGAVIVGKTNVPPNLADFGCENPVYGRTNHPTDPGRTPGGSSGGAAAALAAHLTPLEVGSDLAGSIRIPAAFCGIFGLKPSSGVVPVAGHLTDPAAHPRGGGVNALVSIGPMARTAADLRLAFDALAGASHATPRSRRRGPAVRIGYLGPINAAPVAEDIVRRLERLVDDATSLRIAVARVEPPVSPRDQHAVWVDVHAAAMRHGARWGSRHPRLALRRAAVAAAWDNLAAQFDALLLPSVMTTAFTHRPAGTAIEVDGVAVPYWRLAAYTEPFNLSDLPALAFPAGLDSAGLPIGLQLVGRRGSERRLIDVAARLAPRGPTWAGRP